MSEEKERLEREIEGLERREKDLKDIYKQYEGKLRLKGWEREEKKAVGHELFKLNIAHIHKLIELEKENHEIKERKAGKR